MSRTWPKVFRDPIHNLIAFEDTPCDRLMLDLINSREVQRLRRINQAISGATAATAGSANHFRDASAQPASTSASSLRSSTMG